MPIKMKKVVRVFRGEPHGTMPLDDMSNLDRKPSCKKQTGEGRGGEHSVARCGGEDHLQGRPKAKELGKPAVVITSKWCGQHHAWE